MTLKKIILDVNGEPKVYAIQGEHKRKGDAVVRADIARKTNLFKSVRVVKRFGKWLICIRGVARDISGVTVESLVKETGLSGELRYDRRTGRRSK